tara:strand:- start:1820 stop:2149 length:330 start_codon:yes stop_codon:yes gene_type:complete
VLKIKSLKKIIMKKILLLIAVLPFFNQKNVNAQCSLSFGFNLYTGTGWVGPDSMNLITNIDNGDSIVFEYGVQGFSLGNGTRVGFRRGEQQGPTSWYTKCVMGNKKTGW